MKSNILKFCFLCLAATCLAVDADAQRSGRRRTGNPPANASDTTGQTQTQSEQNNVNRQPSGYNPYGNIPIEVDSTGEGWSEDAKKSLKNDAAFDKSFLNDRTPLPYEHLRWDDALYAEKVWRELDLREKMNQPFRYKVEGDNGDERFISILLKALKNPKDSITAFSDERFTTPMSMAEINQITAGGTADTVPVPDPDDPNKILKYRVVPKTFDAESVVKLLIKEEWVFDREASRMFVRILGIAPLKVNTLPNGQERGSSILFWVYYPDLRKVLARHEVYNPKNMGMNRMTWEELFESRMFSSYITKSTLDNPFNQTIRQKVKDPILSLLEGDNIKERIFNYEQDLWSY